MALWLSVPLQPATQQASLHLHLNSSATAAPAATTAASAQPMDTSTPQDREGEVISTNGGSGGGGANSAAVGSGVSRQQSWGQLWSQVHALTGYSPRLGVLLMVRFTPLPPPPTRALRARQMTEVFTATSQRPQRLLPLTSSQRLTSSPSFPQTGPHN